MILLFTWNFFFFLSYLLFLVGFFLSFIITAAQDPQHFFHRVVAHFMPWLIRQNHRELQAEFWKRRKQKREENERILLSANTKDVANIPVVIPAALTPLLAGYLSLVAYLFQVAWFTGAKLFCFSALLLIPDVPLLSAVSFFLAAIVFVLCLRQVAFSIDFITRYLRRVVKPRVLALIVHYYPGLAQKLGYSIPKPAQSQPEKLLSRESKFGLIFRECDPHYDVGPHQTYIAFFRYVLLILYHMRFIVIIGFLMSYGGGVPYASWACLPAEYAEIYWLHLVEDTINCAGYQELKLRTGDFVRVNEARDVVATVLGWDISAQCPVSPQEFTKILSKLSGVASLIRAISLIFATHPTLLWLTTRCTELVGLKGLQGDLLAALEKSRVMLLQYPEELKPHQANFSTLVSVNYVDKMLTDVRGETLLDTLLADEAEYATPGAEARKRLVLRLLWVMRAASRVGI